MHYHPRNCLDGKHRLKSFDTKEFTIDNVGINQSELTSKGENVCKTTSMPSYLSL